MIRNEIEKTAVSPEDISAPNQGSQQFCPGADFIGFNGHFPNYKLLPAMLQVLFGVLVSEKILKRKLTLKKLDKAKFMIQIKPDDTITVSSQIRPTTSNKSETDKTEIEAKVTITVDKQKAAVMTLFMEAS